MTDEEERPAWENEPTDERKAELEAAYAAQKDTDAPYKGIAIRTLGELEWIMDIRDWRGVHHLNANLSGALMSFIDLRGVSLRGVNLSGADLQCTNLPGASLLIADLSHASLILYEHVAPR